MSKLSELATYLADTRKTFDLFERGEVAYKCGVTEMTVRNFESGATVNTTVLVYYLKRVFEFYQNGGRYEQSDEYADLIDTDPAEAEALRHCYSMQGLAEAINIFKGE